MDIFCEQIVEKKTTVKDIVTRLGIIWCAIILTMILLMFNNMLFGFGFLLIAGVIYGAVILYKRTKIEYEYILTNSILDIDKIFAKSSRKRMVSVDFKNVEVFGRLSEAGSQIAKEHDYSHDINAKDVYYFEYTKDGERQRVFISPSQKILSGLHTATPRIVPEYKESAE